MTERMQAVCFQSTALILLLVLVPHTLLAQEAEKEEGQRFVSVGELAQMQLRSGSTRYVLLDDEGEILSTLRPAGGVSLAEFVGQEVGITARTLVDGDTPILLAENVTSFGEARQVDANDLDRHVALVNHEEDLTANENLLPEPIPLGASQDYLGVEGYGITGQGPLGPVVHDGCGIPGCSACGGGCGNSSCASCAECDCGLAGRFWIRSEYLIWWTDGMDTPALVTASPATTSRANAGVLGVPGTAILFGNEALFSDSRSGGRFRIGKWCDTRNGIGFETEYFFLSDEDKNFQSSSIGEPVMGRPFFNVLTNQQDAELVQFPGLVIGAVDIDAETSLWSINPRLRVNLACEQFPTLMSRDPCGVRGYRLDLLVGYRYAGLEDRLHVREQLVAATNPANPRLDNVTRFDIQDNFETQNDFHGADIGFLWEGYKGPWSLEVVGKVGIGSTSQEAAIRGATMRTENGTTFVDPGGVLALQTNMGTFSQDEFTVLPEVGVTLGYSLSPRTRFLVGYTFMYWNHVVRAGDQVDLNVNPDFFPDVQPTDGPAVPVFAFTDTSFWAQGLSLGLEYRW